eukprot:52401_1
MARDVQFLTNEVREQKQQMDEMEAEMAELHQKEKESSKLTLSGAISQCVDIEGQTKMGYGIYKTLKNRGNKTQENEEMETMRSENNKLIMYCNTLKTANGELNNQIEALNKTQRLRIQETKAMKERHQQELDAQSESLARHFDAEIAQISAHKEQQKEQSLSIMKELQTLRADNEILLEDKERAQSKNNTLMGEYNKVKANYAALKNKLTLYDQRIEAMKERHNQELDAQFQSLSSRLDEEYMMMAHKQELMEQKKELFEMQSVSIQQELKRKQEEWYKQQHAEEKHELDRVKGLLTQLDKLAAVDAKEINMLREQLRKEEDRLNRVLDEKQAQHITRKTYKRKEKQKLCNARKAQRDIVLKRQALDPNHFDRWRDPRDLLNWIMGLNGGQYAKHESKLSEYLGKNHISGQYVYQNGIDKQTLMNEWGIKDENDAASLERDILYLKNWKEVYNMLKDHADSRGLRLMKEKRIDKSNIRDVLVLSIGIGEYNLPELGYGPLPGIVNDLRCYKETFANRYGYTFISNDDYDHREKYEDSYYLSDGDLHELLLETRRKLFSGYDQTQLMFDALIVTISSHGVSKGVVCSDGNIITYNEIHAIFADKTLANIPKIYMIDACRDETAYDADDGEVKEDTSRDTFRMTIFADSDGKSVRGGLLSKYMMEAFEGNVAHKQGLYELVKQATKGMDERGEAILKTPDYVHGTMDDVVFVPNMKRGKVRPVGGKTEDDMKSENPVKKQIN